MKRFERMRNLLYTEKRKGFVALLSVVATGAIGLILSLSLLTIGTVVVQDGRLTEQSARARGMANACAEEALRQIGDALACEGTGTVALGPDACTFRLVPEGDTGCRIETTGTVGNSSRHVRATLTQTELPLMLASWREVAGF